MLKAISGNILHIFQNLQANGFIRARIDGILADLDSPPKLDKNKKHTVEAVIDRLRVKRDSSQRLAESLETCLSLSEGVALIQLTDSKKNLDLVFSSKYSLYSLEFLVLASTIGKFFALSSSNKS